MSVFNTAGAGGEQIDGNGRVLVCYDVIFPSTSETERGNGEEVGGERNIDTEPKRRMT